MQNGGYATSASSVGTASPDLSAPEDEASKYIEEEQPIKPFLSVNNKVENTNGEIKIISRATKSPPPPVALKPVRTAQQISANGSRSSYIESIPSEDSGISTHDDRDRFRIGSDSSKSEITENVYIKPAIYRSKTGETTFVAIGMPIKSPVYNGHSNGDRRRFSSTSSDHADNEHSEAEEETFSLGRNSTRKSMFVDSPMLDRWAELQEDRMFGVRGGVVCKQSLQLGSCARCTFEVRVVGKASLKRIGVGMEEGALPFPNPIASPFSLRSCPHLKTQIGELACILEDELHYLHCMVPNMSL